ncbi:hypothetical protein [Acinetobacter sp. ANC 3791]|uniref:hypothetical protein n=1 Tax=Acinetobacter sp. ANC 3791 TaxID=2529836 RepID=UPI00103B71A3|nr:hypothetical protein [Acinetobacter sp. ANC 3791]TCB86553.1 hypothetical protein E0H90_01685 [Acinetobacter sp. ANC 3791]
MYIDKTTIIGAILGIIIFKITYGLYHGATIRWDRVAIIGNWILVIALVWLIFILIKRLSNKPKTKLKLRKTFNLQSLRIEAQKEFSEYNIIERHGQILICETDIRGEFRELVFVRLNTNSPKRVEHKEHFLVASYPYIPSGAEMRKDFSGLYTKDKNSKISDLNLLFDRAKKEFTEFNVLKRNDRIIILEREKLGQIAQELVFIRIVSEQKIIRLGSDGKTLIARYPYVPSKEEMRQDFSQSLN